MRTTIPQAAHQPLGTVSDPLIAARTLTRTDAPRRPTINLLHLLIFTVILSTGLIVHVRRADAVCNTTPTVYSTATSTTYVVPADCDTLTVKIWGAGGGGGGDGNGTGNGGAGGGGGFARADITVTPLETLDIRNGGGGGSGANGGSGGGGAPALGGGTGGTKGDADSGGGGGGGGYSAVLRASTFLVQAGGGGGGGGSAKTDNGGTGGGGGGAAGQNGGSSGGGGGGGANGSTPGTGGSGGNPGASGSANAGGNGGNSTGANANPGGGGGGAGQAGGGGGGAPSTETGAGGGGGGSSLVTGTNTTQTAAIGQAAANNSDVDYAGNAGMGGNGGTGGGAGANGNPGRIVLIPSSSASGLIAHWTFDEGSGTTAADSVGTNNGTLTNGPTWACVAGGYALNFDGTNDEVSLPGPVVGDRAAWTVTAWIKMGADTADQRTIYSEGDTTADEYWFLYVDDTTDKVKFWSPNGSFTMTGITPVEDNAWHLVTMVQRSKTERELYVGTVSQAIDNTNMGTLTYNTASIGFLRANGWTADPFKGLIDDVRIYDRALSPAEISALAGSPPGACGANTTTIADGTDPGNATIAPGAAITDLDAFTLVASSGTDTVTAATVTLGPAGAFNNIGQADITNASNVAQCTAITNPGSNTLSFTGCTIPVTTTVTTFKVRITPKTHASMPAVPGASYAVTGTVTAFTSTNTQAGTDTDSATVTIDNLSPSNVSGAGATPGDTQVTVSWTNPGDADFSNVVVLRNTATISDVPTEGSVPAIDSTIGTSVVRYIASGTSFIDTGLTNGQIYYYRIFAKDTNGNYAATGVEVSATPAAGSGTTLEVRVGTSSDDAEEWITGTTIGAVVLNSADLEMIHDTGPPDDQTVGMRFQNITIPKGATITNAYIQFTAENSDSAAITLTFHAEDIDNAPTFTTATSNISNRTKTAASVAWNSVPAWTVGNTYQTVDLSSIIQAVVNRAGWASGNALVVIVTGSTSEKRSATSYDGNTTNAPLLHVEYTGGLVAHWTFDEGSGQTAADSVGTNDGTLGSTSGTDANDPTWVCVVGGNALDFDGTSDYVDLGSPASLNLTTTYTVAAWVKWKAGNTNAVIYSSGNVDSDHYRVDVNNCNANGLSLREDGQACYPATSTLLPADTWHHVAVVKDGDTGTNVTFYVDGVNDGTASVGTSGANGLKRIGARTEITDMFFDGVIDDVRIYNRVLSQPEIADLALSAPIDCGGNTTTIADGTAPANKSVAPSSTNNAVDAFTLSTDTGTDTVTALTVTFTGTDVTDVAASGVKIYQDNGGTANEWDAGDTLIGTASFSGSTASFTGLNISVNTTTTQYLVTYDIAVGAAASNTLQGAITAATVTNTLVNNDTTDATLTVTSSCAAFPTVVATNTSSQSTNTTSHTVSLPSGIVSGDLLVVFFAMDTYDALGSSVSWPAGWNELFDLQHTNDVILAAAYRNADGTEGATITVTSTKSDHSAHISYRITGHDSGTAPEAASVTGSTNTPDPPTLSPTWGAEDTLWLVGIGVDAAGTSGPATDDPDNYTNPINVNDADASSAWIRSLRRELNASSENPTTFTISSSDEWVAGTVAVRPSPCGSTTTIADGNSPGNKPVAQSSTNNAVDAFTLFTNTGTDTVTALTVTFTGTDVTDVAASGVKIYQDNGGTPNEWDASDTLIGTASFSGSTASFTGLNIAVNTTATQYLVTYDIAAGATASNTLQGAITAATVTNALINNDTTDATLTVSTGIPIVTSVDPPSGPTAGGTVVTITGMNFASGASVTFDTTPATGVTFVSSTQLIATTPAHAAGPVDVTVTNPDNQSGMLMEGYAYGPAPTVTSVSPPSGVDTGGTAVTITGTDFVDGASVTFDTTPATGVTVVSSTKITATTPAHAAGAVNVTVTNPDFQSGTLPSGFTYITVVCTQVTYQKGDGKGTVSEMDDSHLNDGSTSTNYGTDTTINIDTSPNRHAVMKFPNIFGSGANQIPLGSTICSATLTLTIPSDTGDDPLVYQVTESWVEAEVTWDNRSTGQPWAPPGGANGSHKATDEGSLPAGSTGAQSVGVTTSVQNWSNGEANEGWVLIPSGSGGVTFNTSEHATQSTRPKLTVTFALPPPTVTSIAPTNGPTAGGTAVTITGTNFVTGTTVTFGGTAATGVTFVSSTQITATTPAHVAGVVDVIVTNPDLQSGILSGGYMYTDSPCDANICWDGGGTTNNWSEGANWAGDVVPGAGDTAVFGDLSSKNAVIDVPITINGLIIDTFYTGTVAQLPGMTMTIGSAGYDQKAATFIGANTTIDINGAFTLSGGNMISTSGTMSVQNNFTVSGGTLNHNSGSVTFDGGNKTVNASTAVFNNVTLNQGASDFTVTGTMVVDGNLTITSVSNINGTIAVARDVTSTDTSVTGTGPILLDGTGTQILRANGGTGELPSVTINKSSGTLTIQDTIEISGNWTYTAGTVNAGTSTVVFTTGAQTVASGSMSFNNVTVNNGGSALTVTGTMNVNGNLTLTSLSAINGGTVAVAGNVTSTDTSVTGTGTIFFDGSGAQTLGASGGTGELPNVTIEKSSGTLTIQDTIKVSGNWTYTAGTVNAGTSAVVFTTGGQTIDAGSMSFNHVTFDTGGSSTITGTVDVNGTLTILNVASLEGGIIAVAGNLTSTDASVGGTASITLDGTADQTIAVQDIPNGTFIINKASGTATLINDLILNSGQALNITAGTLDQGSGLDLTAGSITLAADTIWKNFSGSTSTITIGSGGVSNSGTINFNSSTGGCGEADAVRVRSTAGGVSRPWSGIGAFVLIDVDVRDQAGSAAITVFNGTDTGNNGSNWTFNDCDSAPTVIIIDWREVY